VAGLHRNGWPESAGISGRNGPKYAFEARFGTDVFGISGELLDRRRRGLEQSRVTEALVLADEGTQLFRNGKRDQEVMAWELALDLGWSHCWDLLYWQVGQWRLPQETKNCCGSAQPSH
jgi:hypothetical protein